MARVYVSSVINSRSDRVWQRVRDFNGLPSWHPGIAESRIENGEPSDKIGCVRDFRLRNGDRIREKLLGLSDFDLFCTYSILESPMGVENYVATLRLTPITDGDRTFAEWTATTLSQSPGGESCAECHMLASDGAVSTTTPSKVRRVHSHMFPAVDLAVGDFPAADAANGIAPQNAAQQAATTAFLATAIQQTLCLNPVTHKLLLTLDNVGASGHSWPSGATPDRRAWVELTATQGGNVIYASGNSDAVGLFPSALPFEDSSPDPDLWLIRDCIYDASGAQVQMFWQAATVGTSDQLPGLLIQNVNDPTTFQTHFMLQYPSATPLPATPDEVKVTVHLQAIGDDVLDSLVTSGDLDQSVPPQIARYALGGGAMLDWTPTASNAFQATDSVTGAVMTCVATGAYKSNTTPATSHARCPAPAASP